MKTQVKLAIAIGMIALFTIGGLVAYQSMNYSKEELNLNNLIETPYEVIGLNESKKKEQYDLYLIADLDYTNEILLSTKIQKEISSYYHTKNAVINLHVYDQDASLSVVEKGVNLEDETFCYTLQTIGSNVIKYEPLAFDRIKGDVTASSDWQIQRSSFNQEQELTFTTHLKQGLSPESIFSTVKGISDEMSRHNGGVIVKQSIPISKEQVYYHDSHYPNHLIQEVVLMGRGAFMEGVEE